MKRTSLGQLGALLMIAAVSALPASAFSFSTCYKVKVKNESDHTVEVFWKATGCFKVHHEVDALCDHKTLHTGESHTAHYKYGALQPEIVVRSWELKSNSGDYKDWFYWFNDGTIHKGKGWKLSPEGCFEQTYNVNFTNDDFSS